MQLRKETRHWKTFISLPLIMARAEIWESLSHCSLSLAPLKIHPVLMERDRFQWTHCRPTVVRLARVRLGTAVSWGISVCFGQIYNSYPLIRFVWIVKQRNSLNCQETKGWLEKLDKYFCHFDDEGRAMFVINILELHLPVIFDFD